MKHTPVNESHRWAEIALHDAYQAASPLDFTKAVATLLSELAHNAAAGASLCENTWQEKAAGAPWAKLARQLTRAERIFNRDPS